MRKYSIMCDDFQKRKFTLESKKFQYLASVMNFSSNLSCFRSEEFIRKSVSDQDILNMNNNRGRKLPTFKVTLVGPKKCGKSEIIRSNYYLTIPLIHNRWDSNPEHEISYSSNNNEIANVKLCEFPMMFNQEHGLDNALINVDLYCICFSTFHYFDGDNAPTECPDFAKIEKYILPIISHHSPQTPYIVMGCMTDLRGTNVYGNTLNVSSDDGIEFAKKIGALSYIESSSVGYNINKILEKFIKSVVYRKSEPEPSLNTSYSGKCFMQ